MGQLLGQLLGQLGQPAKGRAYVERAVTVDSQLADAYLSLGTADLYEQRPRDAEQQYRRALQANPNSIEAHANLVKLLGKEGKFAEALPWAAAAVRLSPANAELRLLHGTLLLGLNDLPAAEREFEIACRLDPQQTRAQRYLEQVRSALPQK